ncbi:hypothetical protein ACJIZ3_007375 [Penstemon smallii]|uniref:Uncharacterized protein n=1 Tax=Penstemon smallii TaxID=265156 RepID=A0ABD3SAQ1_9LAMI
MVVPLGHGKFYGSSLPRPRFYTDVKHSDERVDPPLSVIDPLMTWAHDAHWSMGGQSFTRHRLQGRIEVNVDKLRAQREKQFKDKSPKQNKPDKLKRIISETPSPPPVAIKRRRVVGLVDEVEEDLEEVSVKRGAERKLGDDFERVAKERKRDLGEIKKKLVKGGRKVESVAAAAVGTRSSPRLAKRGGGR